MIAAPFHEGEQAVQRLVGMQARMAEIGPRVIRDHMPEQHQRFFEQLPMLLAGMADAQGRPWASVLVGPPGFIQAPDAQQLLVGALPLPGDPMAGHLQPGAEIGLLGIEPQTRRRNRANGQVTAVEAGGFGVAITQSVGNCPQYIQRREPMMKAADGPAAAPAQSLSMLDAAAQALVSRADTLFIASRAPATADRPAGGADVSHRGGPPGFVKIEDAHTLLLPDYSGNQMFMTLGNLMVDPRAGLLFIDFDSGDLLTLTGRAELVWDGPDVAALDRAQRAVRFQLQAGWWLPRALPLQWRRIS
ncbi:pyridoxamine 5'-phosphate oxidase family protein [Aquincola tertiaricarbonis]|uniref:pyridoxamine 5'-phosphate oxidase family protein n=1 Tax=Aquincola tertiaricarbonis TaxID=391953 RepID=UPI00061510C8|nr:pyridoxamine 5'-phosphate oxidase family protein [Aquincola tertiaricarbonis]